MTASADDLIDGRSKERRRPGRIEGASRELIALMRRPSPETKAAIARHLELYDAPHFEPPKPDTHIRMNFVQVTTIIAGSLICGLGWFLVFRVMLYFWG